ncbi:MAG: signal peptide peptidase SppA [Candidatus Sericytochromatia bacterium]|nr:signal peptide peptidase SppA [Candidatus Sericytochromatia bacterium]
MGRVSGTRFRRLGGILTAAFFVTPVPVRAEENFLPRELGSLSSVATLEDASALVVNPAALTFQRSSELFVSRSTNGLDQTNLFLAGGGGGFGWQQWRTPGNRFLNAFSLAASSELFGGLALGGRFGYLQFMDGLGGNSPDMSLSLLYRPAGWLAAGLSAHHLNQPLLGATSATSGSGILKRQYRAGLGIRPGTERVTLSMDATWQEGMPAESIVPWLGLQVEPWPGVTVRALADRTLNASVGLGLQWGQLGTGFISGVTSRVGGSDVAYLTSSDLEPRRSLGLGRSRMAYVRLEGDLQDTPQSLIELRQDRYPGVLHLTRRIADAKADSNVTGLVLDLRQIGAGLALLQELRDALADFKLSGKPTVAYVTDPSMPEYYLAVAADKVVMHPAGGLDLRGLSITSTFFKGIFEKLGVEPQFVGIGKYKSAPEQYTRKGLSDPAVEQEKALLDDAYQGILEAIAASRKLNRNELERFVVRGILTPSVAKEKGLVDEVAYPDQVPDLFERQGANTYHLVEYKPETWAIPDVLAVVTIDGAIQRGESSGGGLLDGPSSGSATVTRALRDLRRNDRVKAVVIRVDSPGGDAVAADEIGREIDLLRLANKPVIISMGTVAASGGYWVAANGARIYAEPGTITGSIGVFTGHFAVKGLLDKIGIATQTLQRGPHADMDTGVRALTEQEMLMLKDQARYTYGQFLERVATGRRMAPSRVDELAQGRVWSGNRAVQNGLVDRFGGLEVAMSDARQMAGLDPVRSVVEFYPKPGSLWQSFDDSNMDVRLKRTVESLRRYAQTKTWLIAPTLDVTSIE